MTGEIVDHDSTIARGPVRRRLNTFCVFLFFNIQVEVCQVS